MTNKDLTIIITTYFSEEKIENCLNSIDSDIKVIIIENSKKQKFKSYIENKFSNTECILANDNLGYGKANNIGLKMVATKYALILNPDTTLHKDAIKKFFNFLEKNNNFAFLGPIQNYDRTDMKQYNHDTSNAYEVESIKGFAIFINMSKLPKIGFFDENFFLYLEEIDLCRRAKLIQEKIYVDQNIKIFHDGGKSVNQSFSHKVELIRNWHWMWSLFYFNKKHYNFFYALIIVLPKLFSSFFKYIFMFFINKKISQIYRKRLSGLYNSIIGKKSWYRITLD